MAGSAGSKYGIINDEIPIKRNRVESEKSEREVKDEKLRDIRALVRVRALSKNKSHGTEPK